MNILKSLRSKVENITEVIRAAQYDPAAPLPISEDDAQLNNAAKRQTEMLIGTGAISAASTLAIDYGLGVLEAFSVVAVEAATGLGSLFGGAVLAHYYAHCKKTCTEVIKGQNMAGQTVEGSRLDLYRLHEAQKDILSISLNFNAAAAPRQVKHRLDEIMRETAETRAHVKIHAPRNEAHDYEFVRPVVQFVVASPSSARKHAKRH